ncbi:MAG: glycosyltransferase family 4 protein [Thermodesulfobacteriota bacterium]
MGEVTTGSRSARDLDKISSPSEKSKILILCPDLPYPITAGGHMRMASILEAMSRFAFLAVACVADKVPETTRKWCKHLNIDLYAAPPPIPSRLQTWKDRLRMVWKRDNFIHRPQMQHFLDRIYSKVAPDLVWLETPYLIRYALGWRERVPLVVDFWGTSEGPYRVLAAASGLHKIIPGVRWWIARGGELQYVPKIRDIVCVSQRDADYFLAISPQSRVQPIPVGIVKSDTPDMPSREIGPQRDSQIMMLTGDLSFPPNIDAGSYFVKEIFPRIREKCPAAQIHLVGRNPASELQELARYPGVTIKGWVPDLGREISGATIYVLPMRLGSGFRTKLLDVFPLGKAIVTTTVGTEGLALSHGDNCLVADTAADFAEACVELLRYPDLREKLGASARRLALEVYTQDNISRLIRQTVDRAM